MSAPSRTKPPAPAAGPAPGFLGGVLATLAVVVIGAHLLGAGPLTTSLWGAHAYAFFPRSVLLAALVALTVSLVMIAVTARAGAARAGAPARRSRVPYLWTVLLAALSGALFWSFRSGHTLLGDGNVLTQDLPRGLHTHPHQPLTVFLHHWIYQATHRLFEAAGKTAADVARDTVALGSAAAGVLFVFVVIALAQQLVSRAAGGAPGRATTDRETSAPASITALALVAAGLLCAQGYLQLFFGYVENYTFFTLGLGLYLLAALAYLGGRAPLWAAGVALVLALGLHLSAAILLPSFAVLVVVGFRRAARVTWRDVAITALAVVALQWMLAANDPGYDLRAQLGEIFGLAARGHGEAGRLSYLFSAVHWRDFLNEQFLIGPCAAFLFVPAAAFGLVTGSARNASGVFLVTAGAAALASAWLATELNLGYPRDWDLFAPYALVYTAAAIYCVSQGLEHTARARTFLALALALSLFHTVPWVALNASSARSIERFKTLPLGRGRTEATLGSWYLTHGEPDSARVWFERSVAAHPENNLAQYHLGVAAMDAGRIAEAVHRLALAARLRPDKNEYRLRFADALVVAGRPADALPELEELLRRAPRHASYWACAGVVLLGLDRGTEARAALDRAIQLEPADPIYRQIRDNLAVPGIYQTIVDEAWIEIVTR